MFNQPAYDITFVPREVTQLDTLDLCSALNITREQFDKRMKDVKNRWMNPGYSKYTHQVFMTQLSAEECGVFQEKLFKFPGFYIQRRTIRQYTYNSAGHLLGDIGEVSKKDIENDDYYIRGDYIGKQGIEKSYEKYLRGEKGVEILLRDAHGRIQGHYMDGQLDRSSVPGKNLTLGIDIDLQMLGERLLQHKIGAIVAIEPATGEILCMVSSPTFDPHLMIGRQRKEPPPAADGQAEAFVEPCHHGSLSAGLHLQDGAGADLPSGRDYPRRLSDFPLCAWFQS